MAETILVTSALPYVNGPLHIGHLRSTYIPADVFVRYLRLKGHYVIYICGSDEYGTPTVVAAEQEGLTPKALVDKYHAAAQKNFEALGLSFDNYSRTSTPTNHELTQEIFNRLSDRGFVYKTVVKEYYCPRCKKFLPDRYIKGVCPACGAVDQYSDYCEKCGKTFAVGDLQDAYCTICRTAPELRDSEHFMFKLSAFATTLELYLKKDLDLKEEVKNYVLSWIKEGLRDWDIVRDLDWGVPVPGMEEKVFYVWFNAPIGYASSTKEWAEKIGKPKEWEKFWKVKAGKTKTQIVHFIGKDIIYHHALFWPAMLIGTDEFNPPTTISVRGFATLEGKKFSKSRKWWILIEDYLSRWPPDYLRFYYSLTTPNSPADGDFSWKEFQQVVNTELLGNIGNFIHRVLTFIWTKFDGQIPKPAKGDAHEVELKRKLKRAMKEIDSHYGAIEIDRATKAILDLAQSCNQYFQHKEPWRDEKGAPTTIWHCVNLVRSLAILLEPIIPLSAEKIWAQLKLEKTSSVHEQKFESAGQLPIKAGHKIEKPAPLFKKAEDGQIKKELELLQKGKGLGA